MKKKNYFDSILLKNKRVFFLYSRLELRYWIVWYHKTLVTNDETDTLNILI